MKFIAYILKDGEKIYNNLSEIKKEYTNKKRRRAIKIIAPFLLIFNLFASSSFLSKIFIEKVIKIIKNDIKDEREKVNPIEKK
jgi:hypothetical protein